MFPSVSKLTWSPSVSDTEVFEPLNACRAFGGFPDGWNSKEYTCNSGDTGDLGSIPGSGRFPPEEEMATCSSILTWRSSRTEEPLNLQSMGSQRVGHDWNDWAHRVSKNYSVKDIEWWWRCGEKGTLAHFGVNANWYSYYENKYEVSQKNKRIFSGTCDNLGETRDMILSEIKQNTERQIPHDLIFMRNLKIFNTKKQRIERIKW